MSDWAEAPAEGYTRFARPVATKLKNIVRNSQSAIEMRALVAAWREVVENRTAIASHRLMYTPAINRKMMSRNHSSAAGLMPDMRRPMPARRPPRENTVMKTMVAPARNFALMMVSR